MPNYSPVNARQVNSSSYGNVADVLFNARPSITATLEAVSVYDADIAFAGVQTIAGSASFLAFPAAEIGFSGLVAVTGLIVVDGVNKIQYAGVPTIPAVFGIAAGGPAIRFTGGSPAITGAFGVTAAGGAAIDFDAVPAVRSSLHVSAVGPNIGFAAGHSMTAALATTAVTPSVDIAATPTITAGISAVAVGTSVAFAGNGSVTASLGVSAVPPSVGLAGHPALTATLTAEATGPGIRFTGGSPAIIGAIATNAGEPGIGLAATPNLTASLGLRVDASWITFASGLPFDGSLAAAAAVPAVDFAAVPTLTGSVGVTAAAPSVAFAGQPEITASIAVAGDLQTIAFVASPIITSVLETTADHYHAAITYAGVVPSIAADARFHATPAGPIPDPAAEPTLPKIIRAVRNKLIRDGVVADQCCLVMEDTEPLNTWGSPWISIWPGPQSIVGPDVEGGGRSVNNYVGELQIRCYVQNQMDPAGTDPQRLLNSSPTYGLLALCKSVMSSLQEYIPSDDYNRVLVTDTMICSTQGQANRYTRTRMFLWTTVSYRICYNEILSGDSTFQCSYTP